MNNQQFLALLQSEIPTIKQSISTTDTKEWVIKGFVDVFQNVYTITIDTKVISKVLEVLLYPIFEAFAIKYNLQIELPDAQNHYPDITFLTNSGKKFAVDIKSTIRQSATKVNMMTLGAFTGYFRNRTEKKNIKYPYNQYSGHFVFGIIYSQNKAILNERTIYHISDILKIPSVIYDFDFFAQPKYKIAVSTPGSGNTKNIGSCININQLIKGEGPFSQLGSDIFDDYWMYYLTEDMAKKLDSQRPYTNLKEYLEYKKRYLDNSDVLANLIQAIKNEDGEDK